MPGPAGPANGGARPKTQTAKPKKAKKPPSQKKPSQQKPMKKELKRVERQVKVLKRRTAGPKTNDVMKTTVTVGILKGQASAGLNRQLRVPLNPLLMKSTEGVAATPLSIRASCYEMWKPLSVEFYATPLTGNSNIVGSVGFLALTLNGLEASADSIDTVKARRHIQMALGKSYRFRITARELSGPREGWWITDTSQSPADAYGPAVDLMVAYGTENLLGTTSTSTVNFTGPLWQVEARVTYGFANYAPKPGLQTLVSQTLTDGQTVTIQPSQDDGSLIMTTTSAQILSLLQARATDPKKGKSQTIWAIAGAAVDAAAPILGPWGWLLKGGFWLVRQIFGGSSTRAAGGQYQIYPSLEAAMSDQPIFGQTTGAGQQITLPIVHLSEVMNPNPESNDVNTPNGRSAPAPPAPEPEPELPLALLVGQPGVPAVYEYTGDAYTPQPRWTGSTIFLTGVPYHTRATGASQSFGVRTNNMSPSNCTTLDIYDFTNFGVFFGSNGYLSQGAIHTSKTMIYSLKTNPNINPWLAANQSSTTWAMPTWSGYPTPGQGDFFLQMQDTTDTTTHTTSVGCYFLVMYGESRKLVAFFNTGTGTARPALSSMMCLYNVDAGRAPVRIQGFLLSPSQNFVEFDNQDPDSDDDISLAGSCLQDEFDCVDQLEKEREDLMRRLRDLDLRRFQN